ncbi:10548_t:CDS:2 [Gigaspora margarita]|uniref:10548_t:CDS:1 n=1 Tax=Gigaspora margarita TaxID=4874 RepID=A0ABN7VMW1_GIGMA|nr:10548_t:CDS:2 [Gigaspora margarita]
MAFHKTQLKPPRVKRAQSSTTLQFAPPDWLSSIFQNGKSTFMVHPSETRAGYILNFLNQILSRIFSVPYLAPKLLFITLCAGMGSVIPYLPIFYSISLSLTSTQIGIVFSIAPFISALSCPLWTGLADKFQAHRFIIATIYMLATISVIWQMILPLIIDVNNSNNNGFVLVCVLFAALWFAFFGVPVNALVDSGVLKILGDKRELYGQQRLWGSIAYGSSTLFIGLLWNAADNINVVFYYFFGSAILFVICTLCTDFNQFVDNSELVTTRSVKFNNGSVINMSPHIGESDGDDSSIDEDDDEMLVPDLDILAFPPTSLNLPTASFSNNPTSSMKALLTNPSVVTLLLVMLLMGTAFAMSNAFLLLFLNQELEASSIVLGLTGPISAIAELLFFFYSKELISQFGLCSLVFLAHIVTIIRCSTYIFLQKSTFSYMLALLVQLLNGVGFSALWISGVTHIANNAPPNLISFSQGVMTAVYAGFGTGFGSLFGGILYDSAGGPRVMFGVVVGISIVSLIMYWWGENGFKVNVKHFGGRKREPRFPWQDTTVGGQIGLESTSKSTLSVEFSRLAKKDRYESLSQDDDEEQYHYDIHDLYLKLMFLEK